MWAAVRIRRLDHMRSILRYPARVAALLALTLGSAVVAALTIALLVPGIGLGLVFLIPWPLMTGRRFTNTVRRVVANWSGVPIPVPYQPTPPDPVRRPDGYFEQDGGLHKHRWWPRLSTQLEWLLSDRATGKDLLWLILNPVIGTALIGLPFGLIAAAIWYGPTYPIAWLGIPAAVGAAGPSLRAYGLWCRFLLGPVAERRLDRIAARKLWAGTRLIALVRATALGALGIVAALTSLLMVVASILTYTLGLIFFFTPAVDVVRRLANLRRRLAHAWSGVEVDEPYRPAVPPAVEPDGRFRVGKQLYRTEKWARWIEKVNRYGKDPATWRDFGWTIMDPIVGAIPALVPAGLTVYAIRGLVAPAISYFVGSGFSYLELSKIVLAVAFVAVALLIAPALVEVNAQWTQVLLAPTREAALARRVERLTETRADAVADQATELRRIERDLHDGTQARLVSIGLTLGALETLIEKDPRAAQKLAAQARESSATALTELRALVRGIHPPVLAERGLVEAVRALALDCPLPVTVTTDVPGRVPAAIESAMYFAIGETLTNVVRHAGASSVDVSLRWTDGRLTARVADNGSGGADPTSGTGLAGLRRRLGTFDGELSVDSPAGGPTAITMELPCVLSSPKTTSS